MRTIRQLCVAICLTLILTLSAFAGEMQNPSVTSPPPDQPQTSATGDIQNPSASVEGQVDTPPLSDSVSAAAFALMVNALSVF